MNSFSQRIASRNPSQRAKGSRNGGKVCAMIRRETGRATGSREIVGSWNLSPLMKNGNLLLKANFCGLTLLTAKSDWPGASLEKIKKTFPRIDETGKWRAFNSTDGKGTWWWYELTNEWFLETEPGNWTQLNDRNDQPHWCHPDGRCFRASLEPWLIDDDTNLGALCTRGNSA